MTPISKRATVRQTGGWREKAYRASSTSLAEHTWPAERLRRRQAQNIVPEKRGCARCAAGERRGPRQEIRAVLAHIGTRFLCNFGRAHKRRTASILMSSCRQGRVELSCFEFLSCLFKSARSARDRCDGGNCVIAPTLGGSAPMYISEDLVLPWIGVPIVNYDNHQHSSDENLRLGHSGAAWKFMGRYWRI